MKVREVVKLLQSQDQHAEFLGLIDEKQVAGVLTKTLVKEASGLEGVKAIQL